MKFRAKKRRVEWIPANCGCCLIVKRKDRLNNYQILKEALEELNY